jgi:hypothetical protein
MDYQVAVNCEQLAEWSARARGLAEAHHGHPTADRLHALADDIRGVVPEEWWVTQPRPLDNRIRS